MAANGNLAENSPHQRFKRAFRTKSVARAITNPTVETQSMEHEIISSAERVQT